MIMRGNNNKQMSICFVTTQPFHREGIDVSGRSKSCLELVQFSSHLDICRAYSCRVGKEEREQFFVLHGVTAIDPFQ